MIADLFSVPKTTFLTIRQQQTTGENSLKKIRGDLRPSEQIICRNDPLGAPDFRLLFSQTIKGKRNDRNALVKALAAGKPSAIKCL